MEAIATPTDGQLKYLKDFDARLRRTSLAARGRAIGIQAAWSLALLSGAAIPLAEALGWPSPTTALLGFVVVVATGADRLFSRTVGIGEALDELRTKLGRERRLLTARAGHYAETADPFAAFIGRTEEAIADYDRKAAVHNSAMVRKAT